MAKYHFLQAVIAAVALMGGSGCERPPPTAQEVAAQQVRDRLAEQRRTEAWVANFAQLATRTFIPSLEAATTASVSDMQATVDVLKLFDRAAVELSLLHDAKAGGKVTATPETEVAAKELRAVLVRKQRELFPAMRRTYAAHLSDATSGAQTNFRATGPGGKILRGASVSFSSQAAVAEVHQTLAAQATQLRFTKGEYVYAFGGERFQAPFLGESDAAVRFEE